MCRLHKIEIRNLVYDAVARSLFYSRAKGRDGFHRATVTATAVAVKKKGKDIKSTPGAKFYEYRTGIGEKSGQ